MIELGDKVKDKISGLTGVVTGRATYLYGCVHILVNPGVIKDGSPVEATWIDEDRLDLVKKASIKASASAIAAKAGCESKSGVSR